MNEWNANSVSSSMFRTSRLIKLTQWKYRSTNQTVRMPNNEYKNGNRPDVCSIEWRPYSSMWSKYEWLADYIFQDHEVIVEECTFALEQVPESLFAPLLWFLDVLGGYRREFALIFVVLDAIVLDVAVVGLRFARRLAFRWRCLLLVLLVLVLLLLRFVLLHQRGRRHQHGWGTRQRKH